MKPRKSTGYRTRKVRGARRGWFGWFDFGVALLVVASQASLASEPLQADFVGFETGPVRPLAISSNGRELYATNIPDGELEIFAVTDTGLVRSASVQVGLEPCAVAVASDGRVWVVNHLSDSVSIVDPRLSPPVVVKTLLVGDEPRDIVFAGTTSERAFITTAHRGQQRRNIAAAKGGGDPQFTREGVARADVWVFDAKRPGTMLGGDPVAIMSFFADTPRALATSADRATVYVAGFHSGNQTSAVLEVFVCDSFDPAVGCEADGLSLPAGMEGPPRNLAPPRVDAPFTGSIVKFDNASRRWENGAGTDMNDVVPFRLPDHDVFAVSADSLMPGGVSVFDHVGTTLFNMAVNPKSGTLYVSNTESPNEVLFEGPGGGGSTVQGRLSLARISLLGGSRETGRVKVRHLNKHIDYQKLHSDRPDRVDRRAKHHSLATPLEMVFSSDGETLYVAAYGSARVGVFKAEEIEGDSFDPTLASGGYIQTRGGPCGLILDEARNRLYVMTRFDNALAVIDLADRRSLQTLKLHNPESARVVEGRRFLYDAFETSGNGEASCASCHVFGDSDSLAWNLGNPDNGISNNNQPAVPGSLGAKSFHPMKGPMATQTLRGLSTHGAMHWRGDRQAGIAGEDYCIEVVGAPCVEGRSFMNFAAAFEDLLGREGVLDRVEMSKLRDFALQITLPPSPVRNLDNSLTPLEARGAAHFRSAGTDSLGACEDCHRLDRSAGFFGTGGEQAFKRQTQTFKVPHLRNLYAKIGMFGAVVDPDRALPAPHTGEQVRGYGFFHDGGIDTIEHFLSAGLFRLSESQEAELEGYLFAFDTDLAPMVGQQLTLDADNGEVVGARIQQMMTSASTEFVSPAIGTGLHQCDLVVAGAVAGVARGWVYRPGAGRFDDDVGGSISPKSLRLLASSEGPLTYTCVPPGSGTRIGINRDRDARLDGLDNCPAIANDLQTDTDGDGLGDACAPEADPSAISGGR